MSAKENMEHLIIESWLSVADVAAAVSFYKAAFNATETYRMEAPDAGLVVRLSVGGAQFWLSNGSDKEEPKCPLGGSGIRMILIVKNPVPFFENALKAGATEIFPIGEDYGWRLGRIADPFGLHWEIGHQLEG